MTTGLNVKTCTHCGQVKPLSDFYKQKSSKDGHAVYCKPCDSKLRKARKAAEPPEQRRAKSRAYYEANSDTIRARAAAWHAENGERAAKRMRDNYAGYPERYKALNRTWRNENADQIRAQKAAKRAANPEPYRAKRRQHYAENKHMYVENAIKRKTHMQQATPAWADKEMVAKAYEACDFLNMVTGEWHEVDHVIPLKSKVVCGLHVHDNLQILTALENRKKSNSFIV